jgi:hypothetical protein
VTPPSTLTFGRPDPLVEGDAQSQARAREQLRREQLLALAHKKGWPELNPNDLKRTLAGLEHTSNQRFSGSCEASCSAASSTPPSPRSTSTPRARSSRSRSPPPANRRPWPRSRRSAQHVSATRDEPHRADQARAARHRRPATQLGLAAPAIGCLSRDPAGIGTASRIGERKPAIRCTTSDTARLIGGCGPSRRRGCMRVSLSALVAVSRSGRTNRGITATPTKAGRAPIRGRSTLVATGRRTTAEGSRESGERAAVSVGSSQGRLWNAARSTSTRSLRPVPRKRRWPQ